MLITLTACDTIGAKTYKIVYSASEGGYIFGLSEQEVSESESGEEVTAIANEGYRFVKWSDGKTELSRRETGVVENLTFTAEFERNLFAGGTGDETSPYLIATYAQLIYMERFPYSHYKLINDLDLSGINHEPVFNDNFAFYGDFDGNGKTIRNLNVDSTKNFPSLFGFLQEGSSVKNLTIENAKIHTINFDTHQTRYCVGILAGVSMANLEDINVSGAIESDGIYYDMVAIGGLVGMAYNNLSNCIANVNLGINDIQRLHSSGGYNPFCFGGISGVANSANFTDCQSSGTISVSDSYYDVYVGGMVGYYITSKNVSPVLENCVTDIKIIGDDTMILCGGFISEFYVKENFEVLIKGCLSKGEISGVRNAGGFIYQIIDYGKLIISNCSSENAISSIDGASFIYRMRGDTANHINIYGCHSVCNITAQGTAAGFFYQANNVDFDNCYVSGYVSGEEGVGFGHMLDDSNINCCFADCDINALLRGAGFCFTVVGITMQNSYSLSDITITNTDPDYSGRTLVGGIAVGVMDSTIKNCFYAGNIVGGTYSGQNAAYKPIVGAFAGLISNSNIINCHVLHKEKEFAPQVVGIYSDDSGVPDITIYEDETEMYNLADVLNEDIQNPVWKNTGNGFPELIENRKSNG